jgi:hypothetical protein
VYDVNGAERDLAWLAQAYDGCRVEEAMIEGYEKVFRIVAIFVTEGPATFKAEVRNLQDQPHSGQPVAFSWPSLEEPDPELPDLTQSGAPIVWTSRGVNQRTDGGGLTGFGLGQAYGPLYQSWVISPSTPSDCIVGAGMKGGTFHRGPLHVVWALREVDRPFDTLDEALRGVAEKRDLLPVAEANYLTRTALERANAAGELLWPTGDEFWVGLSDQLWYDWTDRDPDQAEQIYVARRFRVPQTADVVVLYTELGDYVGPPSELRYVP